MRRIRHVLLGSLAASLLATGAAQAGVPDATLRGDKAVAPNGAPTFVKKMIAAGNDIRSKPYKWGGGHGDWTDSGYDCSGAVSYVLHKADVLGQDWALDSAGFMKWGENGPSKWVTVYANPEHAYMIVAGLRFDTSYITDGDRTGPGWSEQMRSANGFKARHPDGSRNW
jgi:hypothetical protein